MRRLRKIRWVVLRISFLCLVKVVVHQLGFELIAVNQLFSALVASTVFLLGFLLSGVLQDFKESEKIPGELATSLESLLLEIQAIPAYHPEARVGQAMVAVVGLGQAIVDWLHELMSTDQLLTHYRVVHREVVGAAVQFKGDASTLRGRLMAEMAVVLQKVNRIQQIRDTTFVPLVYWMADITALLLVAGLVMSKTDNILESVFFLAVISFVVILLLRLIDDIDNPFGASDPTSAEDVSIELLERAVERLKAIVPVHEAAS